MEALIFTSLFQSGPSVARTAVKSLCLQDKLTFFVDELFAFSSYLKHI